MNAIGAILTLFFCMAVFVLPRRLAALAVLGSTLYITEGQAVDLGINFLAVRFIEVAAFLRVLTRRELGKINFTPTDKWLLYFFTALVVIYALRTKETDIYQLGTAVDGWLVYFSIRALIVDFEDFTSFMKGAAFLFVPFAALMTVEALTGHNLFAPLMGGVPDTPILREGHYRCQGSFRIAITAGSLGATFVSLFVGYTFQRKNRFWALIGIVACIAIVLASHSSGPLMAAVTAIAGWACWYVRHRMQTIRRGIVATLVLLHLTMSAPVWFIFDRISGVLGGDGWHRSNLIDKFILNFRSWYIGGMPFADTSSWAATQLPWGGVDITNYYVSIGIVGGLLPFILFIVFLTSNFKLIGRALWRLRAQKGDALEWEPVLWGLGCTLCSHVVNLTAVQYWDQFYVIWYIHLAALVSLSTYVLSRYPSVVAGQSLPQGQASAEASATATL